MDPEDPSTTVGLPCTQQTGSKDLVTRRRVFEDKYKHNRCDVGRGRPSWCCVTQTHTHTQRERERERHLRSGNDRPLCYNRQTDRQTDMVKRAQRLQGKQHSSGLAARPATTVQRN